MHSPARWIAGTGACRRLYHMPEIYLAPDVQIHVRNSDSRRHSGLLGNIIHDEHLYSTTGLSVN